MVSKRFPADTALDELTFLNDKNIDGELYAYLQSRSMPVKSEEGCYLTVVPKKSLPSQSEMCVALGIKSPKTLRNHLTYLLDRQYVILQENGDYLLPELENIYFLIPLHTLQYLNDNCREHIIKIYVYLGQRFKYALAQGRHYEFSLEELGSHIGIKVKNNSRGYEIINNALNLLYNSGLIDYCSFFDGKSQKKKLTSFSFEVNKKSE